MGNLFHGQVPMHMLDGVVFFAYIVVLLMIGMYCSYRQRKSEDLFLGGRSMGWGNVGLSIFGTNIGPTFFIATFGAGYTTGMVNANFEWMAWIFLMLLAMAFSPFYLHTKITTMPAFLQKRFGNGCYTFYAFYSLFGTVVLWIGGTLFAGGDLLAKLLGWDFMTCVWLLTLVTASFTVLGGLVAVMVTDSYQSILMIVGAGAMTLIAGSHIESFDSLKNLVVRDTPPGMTWKLFHPAGATPWYAFVLGYPVLSLWFWCSDQTIVQRVLGARDLKQGQGGALFCGFLKILPPFIFLLPGILCAVLNPNIEDDKEVYLYMVKTYLPVGMVGLMVSVLVAAVISTLESGLNSFSTVFTLDIYKRWMNPNASEHRTKIVGQFVTFAAAMLAVGIAYYLSRVQGSNLFNLFQGIIGYLAPPISAVFVIGIFWKRTTAKAAFFTLLFGSILSVGVGVCDINNLFAKETFAVAAQQIVLDDGGVKTPLAEKTVKVVDGRQIVALDAKGKVALDAQGMEKVLFTAPLDKTIDLGPAVWAANPEVKHQGNLRTWFLAIGQASAMAKGTILVEGTNATIVRGLDDIWPHFLLLSFYLFALLSGLLVLISLSTQHSPAETPLPTFAEAYQQNPGLGAKGFIGWGVLAAIMVCLYLFFQFAMSPSS